MRCCGSSTSSRSSASRRSASRRRCARGPRRTTGRRAYADEVAGLYAAYRRKLERLGRRDEPLHAAAALDAVREDPAAWGATPVFVYGFDDLTALQRDAVETLAATGAQVTLSLAYEPGRMAFSGPRDDVRRAAPRRAPWR